MVHGRCGIEYMVKYDKECLNFKYYNQTGEHEYINNMSYEKASEILCDLLKCPQFHCDSTVLNALYIGMQKLAGLSDKDIQKLMNNN